ncbi:MAG: hypothetical protein ABL921_14050 [Pirellula sp.]
MKTTNTSRIAMMRYVVMSLMMTVGALTTRTAFSQSEVASTENDPQRIIAELKRLGLDKDTVQTQQLRERLKQITLKQFREMEATRVKQLSELESRVEELRKVISDRANQAEKIVERRIKNLLDEGDGLGWELKDSDPTRAKTSPNNKSQTDNRLDSSRWEQFVNSFWEQLGLRLSAVPTPDMPVLKGGLQVVEVRKVGPAERAKLTTEDIIYGVMDWQTPKLESLDWILKNPSFYDARSFKVYLIRNQKQLTLSMSLEPNREAVASLIPPSLKGVNATETKAVANELRIAVDGTSRYVVDGSVYEWDQLESLIKKRVAANETTKKSQNEGVSVSITLGEGTPFLAVKKLMDLCQTLNISQVKFQLASNSKEFEQSRIAIDRETVTGGQAPIERFEEDRLEPAKVKLLWLQQQLERFEEDRIGPVRAKLHALKQLQLGDSHPSVVQIKNLLEELDAALEKKKKDYADSMENEQSSSIRNQDKLATAYATIERFEEERIRPVRAQLQALKQKQLGDSHPSVVQVKHVLDELESQLAKKKKEYADRVESLPRNPRTTDKTKP